MAQIGTIEVKIKVVGVGRSRLGLLLLGLVARVFKINLEVVADKGR